MSNSTKKRIMFFNGKFLPEDKIYISPTAHALHYGTGCFEGIRAYWSEKDKALFVFRLEDHFRRFQNSCKVLFIDLKLSTKELFKITTNLVQKNFSDTDIYIRPLAFKSDPAVGNFNLPTLESSLLIYTIPLGRYLNTEKGIKANISSWMRIPDNAIPPRGKISGAYVNTALAKTESLQNGFDECIMLDRFGHIAEGSAENFFMVKNGNLITPPIYDDILVGITRDTVIQIAEKELGLKVIERSIARAEVYSADEIFVCGTGAEVTPVVEIDKHEVGDGKIGPIAAKIGEIYFKVVHNELPKYSEFLTKVTSK